MGSASTVQPERRRHRRYIVTGEAELQAESAKSRGELLNLSATGLLLRNKVVPPVGTEVGMRFRVRGSPVEIRASAQVVRTGPNWLAVAFLKEPPEMPELLRWLQQGNHPWSGMA